MKLASKNSGYWLVLIIALVCVMIQAYLHIWVSPVGTQDESASLMAARDLNYFVTHEPEHSLGITYHGAGYPLAIHLLTSVVGNDIFSAILLNIVFAIGFLAVVFLLIRDLHSKQMALYSVSVFTVMPTFVYLTTSINDSMGAAFFAVISIYCFIRYLKTGRMIPVLLVGVFSGCAYLFRYYYGAFIFFIIFHQICFDKRSILMRAKVLIILILSFFVAISPLGIVTLITRGSFFYNHSYGIFAFNVLDKENSWLKFIDYATKYKSLADVILSNPYLVARYSAKNLYYFFSHFLIQKFYIAGLLSPFGMFLVLKKMNRKTFFLFIILSLTVLSICITSPIGGFYRYLLICDPFIVALSYVALNSELFPDRISDICGRGTYICRFLDVLPLKRITISAIYILFIFQLLSGTEHQVKYAGYSSVGSYARDLGLYIGENYGHNKTITSTIYSIAYYGKLRHIPLSSVLPRDSSFSNLNSLNWEKKGIDFLAYVDGQSSYEYPELKYLLNPENVNIPEEFKALKGKKQKPVMIYKISDIPHD